MYSDSFSKKLNYKLRELEIIIKHLDSDNKPSLIDVDLALEKTRELYDILLKLYNVDNKEKEELYMQPKRKPVVPPDPETIETENIFHAEEVIPDQTIGQGDSGSDRSGPGREKSTLPETVNEENNPVKENASQNDGTDNKPGKVKESNKEKNETRKKHNGGQEIEIVADRYLTSQNYINQAMASKTRGEDITTRSQSKPVKDLRRSIGLNDKFLFIKELFNGRPDKYNQCIDNLNRASSLGEALDFIKTNCSWEEDNEIAERLLNLVKRRHQPE
jgi:hypothetical protein